MKNKKEKKTEREKILEAIAYCKKKYKCEIVYAEINFDSDFSLKKDAIEGITIRKVKNINPNNYWIMIPDIYLTK